MPLIKRIRPRKISIKRTSNVNGKPKKTNPPKKKKRGCPYCG